MTADRPPVSGEPPEVQDYGDEEPEGVLWGTRPPVSGEPPTGNSPARWALAGFAPDGTQVPGLDDDRPPVSGESPEDRMRRLNREWADRPPVSGEASDDNDCWTCGGSGDLRGDDCPACLGTGERRSELLRAKEAAFMNGRRPPVSGEPRPDLWLKGYRMGYEDAQIEAEARATPALDVLTMVQAYANVEGAGAHDGKRRHPAPWVEHRVKSLLAEYARLAEQEGEGRG